MTTTAGSPLVADERHRGGEVLVVHEKFVATPFTVTVAVLEPLLGGFEAKFVKCVVTVKQSYVHWIVGARAADRQPDGAERDSRDQRERGDGLLHLCSPSEG